MKMHVCSPNLGKTDADACTMLVIFFLRRLIKLEGSSSLSTKKEQKTGDVSPPAA